MSAQEKSEIEQLQRQLGEERLRNRDTTFHEFLSIWHQHVHKPFSIETDKARRTKGSKIFSNFLFFILFKALSNKSLDKLLSTTKPKGKYYPKRLEQWDNFPQRHQRFFGLVDKFLSPTNEEAPRFLDPASYIERDGRKLNKSKHASEDDLRSFSRFGVEDFVRDIIHFLCSIDQAREELWLEQGLLFDNHSNSLSNDSSEVQERLRDQASKSLATSKPNSSIDPEKQPMEKHADQYCVYKSSDDKHYLLFIIEYKPGHKLSTGNIRAGFKSMDVKVDVIDRYDLPAYNEEEARLQYNADKLVAAVATQTYHYMILNRLRYSYITNGEAFVFLHVTDNDPTTLYYHVTVPKEEIQNDGLEFPYSQVAISQIISLCLMAFSHDEPQHSNKWLLDTKSQLNKWEVDWNAILDSIPLSEKKKTPISTFRARNIPFKRDPIQTRVSCKDSTRDRQNESSPSPSSGPSLRSGPKGKGFQSSKQTDRKRNEASKSRSINSKKDTHRQYCTQSCLLGLTHGLPIDDKCPNALLHPRLPNHKHTINGSDFCRLIKKQLAVELDEDFEPLGIQGARGALFKITLTSHSYVVVGKGTVQAFRPDLINEGRVYEELTGLQGTAIPVYLGNIDLLEWYNLDLGVTILHMLFLSWGGDRLDESSEISLRKEIQRTVAEVEEAGISQEDVRYPNLLWNEDAGRVLLIDFERARSIKPRPIADGAQNEILKKSVAAKNKDKKRLVESKIKAAKRRGKKLLDQCTSQSCRPAVVGDNPL